MKKCSSLLNLHRTQNPSGAGSWSAAPPRERGHWRRTGRRCDGRRGGCWPRRRGWVRGCGSCGLQGCSRRDTGIPYCNHPDTDFNNILWWKFEVFTLVSRIYCRNRFRLHPQEGRWSFITKSTFKSSPSVLFNPSLVIFWILKWPFKDQVLESQNFRFHLEHGSIGCQYY